MQANQNKKILNVFPVVASTWNETMARAMEKYLAPGFELHHRNVQYGGMESVEGLYYMAVTVPYVVEEILKAEKEGYDAVTVGCFGSPGVPEARELVNIPVVGAGEAAFYLALILGRRLGIITVGGTYRSPSHSALMYNIREMVRVYGLSERVVSIRTTGLPVEDSADLSLVEEGLSRQADKIIQDGAEVIILGCTGMTGFGEELQRKLDVPVVDPSVAALKFAEMLITTNLTHSRLTTPSPHLLGVKCMMKYPPTLEGYQR